MEDNTESFKDELDKRVKKYYNSVNVDKYFDNLEVENESRKAAVSSTPIASNVNISSDSNIASTGGRVLESPSWVLPGRWRRWWELDSASRRWIDNRWHAGQHKFTASLLRTASGLRSTCASLLEGAGIQLLGRFRGLSHGLQGSILRATGSIKLPNMSIPQFKLPAWSFTLPKIQLPKLSLPKFNWPTVKLPNFQMPDISWPSFTLPVWLRTLPTVPALPISFKSRSKTATPDKVLVVAPLKSSSIGININMRLTLVFIAIIAVMCGGFYWYFNWSQERIAILQENNAKLTVAVEEQKQTIAAIQKHAEEQAQQMNELQKGLNEANSARRDLEEKFLKFDLEQLARKDSQDLERKMNNATDRAFRQIEGDTGGKPKPLKQKGKDPCAADPKNPACKIPSTKATPVLKDVPLPPKASN
jgi:hypothetical protein